MDELSLFLESLKMEDETMVPVIFRIFVTSLKT